MGKLTKEQVANNDVGDRFEKAVTQALSKLVRQNDVRFLRLYDTKSTGGTSFIPKQPADFILAYSGTSCLMECKASIVHESLASCLSGAVASHQASEARLWQNSGNESFFLFYSEKVETIEVWDGKLVGERYATQGARLKRQESEITFNASELDEALKFILRLKRRS